MNYTKLEGLAILSLIGLGAYMLTTYDSVPADISPCTGEPIRYYCTTLTPPNYEGCLQHPVLDDIICKGE